MAAAAAVEAAVGEVATEGVADHQKQNHWHGMRQQQPAAEARHANG